MGSYLGKHAEYYDIFYADKPYADEAEFVHACVQEYGEGESVRLLELACGTGNHAAQFARMGYDVLATDYSADMLEQAKGKLPYIEGKLRFAEQDMREIDLDEPPFDVVVSLFDSIGYVQTNASIDHVLRGVAENLRPGGLFIFEFWHAAAMLKNFDSLRVRKWNVKGGELLRISQTELEVDKQLAHVHYTIYDLREDGTYGSLQETQTNRYFLRKEMQNILQKNKFSPLEWYAGFTDNEEIDEEVWHIVAVARWEG